MEALENLPPKQDGQTYQGADITWYWIVRYTDALHLSDATWWGIICSTLHNPRLSALSLVFSSQLCLQPTKTTRAHNGRVCASDTDLFSHPSDREQAQLITLHLDGAAPGNSRRWAPQPTKLHWPLPIVA